MKFPQNNNTQRHRTSLYLSGVDEEADDDDDEDEIEYGTAEPPPSTTTRRHATRNSRRISPLPTTLTDASGRIGEVFACSSAGSRAGSSQHNLSPTGALLGDDPFLGSPRLHHGAGSAAEFFASVSASSQRSGGADDVPFSAHDASPPTTIASIGDDLMSDNDEYKPPSIRKLERESPVSGRGGRSSAKKKPTTLAGGGVTRQSTSMRTRSGGKPPTTSYARIGYIDDGAECVMAGAGHGGTVERVRRTRNTANKGKGNAGGGGRGRRGGGRGSKYANFLFPSSSSSSSTPSSRRDVDLNEAHTTMTTTTTENAVTSACGGIATTTPVAVDAAVVAAALSSANNNNDAQTHFTSFTSYSSGGNQYHHYGSAASSSTTANSATLKRNYNGGGGNGPTTAAIVDENDYVRTAVVTNAADAFMSASTLCLICGSVGRDLEGTMITCASCAQSYHTYCVGVHEKLNLAVLKRGWRCLDCTVCEGCGDGKDESNLLLCDECDVSFHTYCLDPPLEKIPSGSWRCKWCAMCCRCNKKVQSSVDLQRFEGLCEVCYSLRKCLKCARLYEIGELIIKCQRCVRWFHAKCEHLHSEEQAENAAENAFRCAFCRPQSSASYNDVLNTSVIVDNVMIDKSAADHVHGGAHALRRVQSSVFNGLGGSSNSIQDSVASVIRNSASCDIDEFDADDMDSMGGYMLMSGGYAGRGGRGGCGRGGGPGRRPPKLGVGGFNVRIPRHRFLAAAAAAAAASTTPTPTDDQAIGVEGGGTPAGETVDDAKAVGGKIRRTRKSRKPQLENAYPPEIQMEFFGFGAVDSRSLIEQIVDEPVLGEFQKSTLDASCARTGAALCEQAAETLRNEQEQDMLGDIFTGVGDLPIDLDFDDIIMNGADDDDEMEENGGFEDSLTDGFSASESTVGGLITGMCSPSTSAVGGVAGTGDASHFDVGAASTTDTRSSAANTPGGISQQHQHHFQMQLDDHRKRQMQLQNRLGAVAAGGGGGSNNNNSGGGASTPTTAVVGAGPTMAMAAAGIQRSNSRSGDVASLVERVSQSNQATERWEEDEPLGDKATKAAVLYANLCHPHFKTKYPAWSERVKQITREWRLLDAEKRQLYVDMARKNRANSGAPIRRRTRRTNVALAAAAAAAAAAASGVAAVNNNNNGATFLDAAAAPPPQQHDSALGKSQVLIVAPPSQQARVDNTTGIMPSAHAVTDPVSAHVSAIKQAQARAIIAMQNQQRKEFDSNNASLREANGMTNGELQIHEELKGQSLTRQHHQQLLQQKWPPALNASGSTTAMCNVSATGGAFIVRQQSVSYANGNAPGYRLQPAGSAPFVGTSSHSGGAGISSRFVHQNSQQHQQRMVMMETIGGVASSSVKDESQSHFQRAGGIPLTIGEHVFPQKSGRGRKRKKPLMEDYSRSPMLGNVAYCRLQTALERDVYDTLDGIVNCVTASMAADPRELRTHDVTSIKRILYAQQAASSSHGNGPTAAIGNNLASAASMSSLTGGAVDARATITGATPLGPPTFFEEAPRAKKKRQQFKKHVTSDTAGEYETVLSRLQSQLDAIQFPKRSLEQFNEFDTNILYYPQMTSLAERPGKSFIEGSAFGKYACTFMPDYYSRLEKPDEIDEDRLFAAENMSEFDTGFYAMPLKIYDDDDDSMNTLIGANISTLKQESTGQKTRTDLLNECVDLNDLTSRLLVNSSEEISLSTALLGSSCVGDLRPPLEPHRSFFYKKFNNVDDEGLKVSLIMEADSIANATELMEKLREVLDVKGAFEYHIETPPQSPPNATLIDDEMEKVFVVKSEPYDESNATTTAIRKSAKRCRNCGEFVCVMQKPIEEPISRLGLTPPDEKDDKVSFCSMPCYYRFMVKCKVPLSVELLERAEKYVDISTMEKLRQISTDSFVKKLQQQTGDVKPSVLSGFDESTSGGKPSFVEPISVELLAEMARAPREQMIRACDLPTILQEMEARNRAASSKTEYKWRDHSWMICDATLLASFRRAHDERCASARLEVQETNNRARRVDDTRSCVLCAELGDGERDTTGRLLNVDANEWVHVNCALWSSEVHETESGALLNVDAAIRRARAVNCLACGRVGASLSCYKLDCPNHGAGVGYHLKCARAANAKFIRDRTFYCPQHEVREEMRVYRLDALRRIYVQREENQLLSKIFTHSYSTEMMMRVGNLIFQKIGQLLPEQLKTFHNENHIFPIGYRIIRIFWSPTNPRERQRYECWIEDRENRPEFCVSVEGRSEFRDATPDAAWNRILLSVLQAREKAENMLRFFPNQITGEALFGFLEPAITKMTESLPGVDQLFTYTFKHGGSPLMDLPLAVNPSGCARCEPCFRTLIKHRYRPLISGGITASSQKKEFSTHFGRFNAEVISRESRSTRAKTTRFQVAGLTSSRIDQDMLKAYRVSGISEEMLNASYNGNAAANSSIQLSNQYKDMQKQWPDNVYLARSKIQGFGLYAKRDICMDAMIIEYKGEVIRSEVGETREKRYMSQNRGVYMFRINDELFIDATMAGGPARYINHSCDPNCSTKILQHFNDKKIIITANRPIKAGEELTYDYQFELEEAGEKLPCLCGAPNCNKWMN